MACCPPAFSGDDLTCFLDVFRASGGKYNVHPLPGKPDYQRLTKTTAAARHNRSFAF
jgi:hypothetical protein